MSPDIEVELNDKAELIGIEILDACEFLCDMTADSVQAKLLGMPQAGSA